MSDRLRGSSLALLVALALVGATEAPAPDAAKPDASKPGAPLPRDRDPGQLYGFSASGATIDRSKIVPGGPGRDGIHAVDAPRFAEVDAADAIAPDTPVVGVSIQGDARAYLLPILEYHQVVNDTVGGAPIAVTYDPLTGAARVFRRNVDGRTLRFGVSGLVYNSGFLLFDRETESLWSQYTGRAIAGTYVGKRLESLRVREEEFATWRKREPKTRILIPPEPDGIDYNRSIFAGYSQEDRWNFPVEAGDRRFHAKELTVGVTVGGTSRAYLASLLTRNGGHAEDEIGGKKISIRYDADRSLFEWEAPPDVDVTESYWFAWKAFHPDTEIWRDPGEVKGRAP
jgi:Protein of unknown function (DUF3179)